MPRLRVLSLARNDLGGAVPRSLGALTELVSLDLSRNRFSGALPIRPDAQPSLRQMKFHGEMGLSKTPPRPESRTTASSSPFSLLFVGPGNDDLIAPDRWLRHDTLRFKLEKEAARVSEAENGKAKTPPIGRAHGGAGLASVSAADVLQRTMAQGGPRPDGTAAAGELSWAELTRAVTPGQTQNNGAWDESGYATDEKLLVQELRRLELPEEGP